MRNQVFISYRHESSEHSRAVRRLSEMIRLAGLPVMLDQFYLEDHPGGPDEGWPKWCEDCALESACVLIVASEGWFGVYDKTDPPGQGLGAATEADLFRQELWDQRGHNDRIRLVFLHSTSIDNVPVRLRAWHQFRPFDPPGPADMIKWIAQRVDVPVAHELAIRWPDSLLFQPDLANRENEWKALVDLLSGKSRERILLFEGSSGVGKSTLVRQSKNYAQEARIPVAFIDFKGGALKTDDVLNQIGLDLGALLPNFSREESKKIYTLRKDLRALRLPVLFIFDSYEDTAGNQNIAEWLNVQFLGDLLSAPAVAVLIAGQKVPEHVHTNWRDLARSFVLNPIKELEAWKDWASRRYPDIQERDLNTLLIATDGHPSLMAALSKGISKAQ